MGSVLIAMPRRADADHLAELVNSRGLYMDVEVCQTASEILRIANDRDFGVIVCTKTLADMGYHELSEYMPPNFGMIILTKDMSLDIYSDRIVKLTMPFKPGELISTIEMVTAPFLRRRKKKDAPPKKRTEEEETIIREAKNLLMDRHGMSEPEAFRYIQKSSMDAGRSMVESAQMILILNS